MVLSFETLQLSKDTCGALSPAGIHTSTGSDYERVDQTHDIMATMPTLTKYLVDSLELHSDHLSKVYFEVIEWASMLSNGEPVRLTDVDKVK